MTTPWTVVGLGNPGPEYASTRHNAGFLVVDELVRRGGGRLGKHKGRALVESVMLSSRKVVLVQPQTYMNLSGGPVSSVLQYFSGSVDRLVVVHDELDLPFGTLRVKQGGGDGGHNGLKSIRASLGTGDWLRVRVGIGRPPGRQDPADYVLKPFAAAEREHVGFEVDRAADVVEKLLVEPLTTVQNWLHIPRSDG